MAKKVIGQIKLQLPGGQATPHPPQFSRSFDVFTQVPSHSVRCSYCTLSTTDCSKKEFQPFSDTLKDMPKKPFL